jgi:hypothetical protein
MKNQKLPFRGVVANHHFVGKAWQACDLNLEVELMRPKPGEFMRREIVLRDETGQTLCLLDRTRDALQPKQTFKVGHRSQRYIANCVHIGIASSSFAVYFNTELPRDSGSFK